jgi:hypothetical protein
MAKFLKKNEEKEISKGELDVSIFEGQVTGFEQTNSETFKTPFLKVLQLLSPELNPKKESDYVETAKPGMFCNTATKEVFNKLDVIVLNIEHNLVVWKPNRGGFVGVYPKAKENEIVHSVDGIKKYDEEMNEIYDTINFFCMNANNYSDLFVISLSNTSFKHGRNWSTKIRMLKSNEKPIGFSYAGVWTIQTVEESNDLGSWYTIGNTPTFKRFITSNEFYNCIEPALKILENNVVDYEVLNENKKSDENVEY